MRASQHVTNVRYMIIIIIMMIMIILHIIELVVITIELIVIKVIMLIMMIITHVLPAFEAGGKEALCSRERLGMRAPIREL